MIEVEGQIRQNIYIYMYIYTTEILKNYKNEFRFLNILGRD